MHIPFIIMIHRVDTGNNSIPPLYYQRNMVMEESKIFNLVESLMDSNYTIGSIESARQDEKVAHLAFDDGFKEHLQIAKRLKARYNLQSNDITFSINVGNSVYGSPSGMDVVYKIISQGQIADLLEWLSLATGNDWEGNITNIKNKVISLSTGEWSALSKKFLRKNALQDTFLDHHETKLLSELFTIASHGVTHRDMRNYPVDSYNEMIESKKVLETVTGKEVDIFCYPEGKNNKEIQQFCKEAGYKCALSIAHERDNPFCIGRFCSHYHKEEIIRRIDGFRK